MSQYRYIKYFKHAGFALIVGIAYYLGVREDSCFFSVPWLPRKLAIPIQHATMYRNFIGFGILGIYAGFSFGEQLSISSKKRLWILCGLFAFPLLKEILQIPLPNRHATVMGAFHGFSGIGLGLAFGKAIHSTIFFIMRKWRPSENMQPSLNRIMKTRLDHFDARDGLERGRPSWYEAIWYLVKCIFFLSPLPWPVKLRIFLLRCFGSKIGVGVVIKPRVNIHFPWKLEVGDYSWIGEEVFILNFEVLCIGAHACISQRAFLCGGNHDFRDPAFRFRNGPITVGAGAWVGAQSFVGPGVVIGDEAVCAAGSIVTKDLEPNRIYAGNPAKETGVRWKE